MSDKFVSICRAGSDYTVVINGEIYCVFASKDGAVKFAMGMINKV